jgi:hypothetical protein
VPTDDHVHTIRGKKPRPTRRTAQLRGTFLTTSQETTQISTVILLPSSGDALSAAFYSLQAWIDRASKLLGDQYLVDLIDPQPLHLDAVRNPPHSGAPEPAAQSGSTKRKASGGLLADWEDEDLAQEGDDQLWFLEAKRPRLGARPQAAGQHLLDHVHKPQMLQFPPSKRHTPNLRLARGKLSALRLVRRRQLILTLSNSLLPTAVQLQGHSLLLHQSRSRCQAQLCRMSLPPNNCFQQGRLPHKQLYPYTSSNSQALWLTLAANGFRMRDWLLGTQYLHKPPVVFGPQARATTRRLGAPSGAVPSWKSKGIHTASCHRPTTPRMETNCLVAIHPCLSTLATSLST